MKGMISDRKFIAAVNLVRQYCNQHPCDKSCKAYNKATNSCSLEVRSPAYFPVLRYVKEDKSCKSK